MMLALIRCPVATCHDLNFDVDEQQCLTCGFRFNCPRCGRSIVPEEAQGHPTGACSLACHSDLVEEARHG